MHQIKLFEGSEDGLTHLEKEVNQWLRESNARVVQVFGNIAPQSVLPAPDNRVLSTEGSTRRFAPSDILVCVVYEA